MRINYRAAETEANGRYAVDVSVSEAEGIPPELFVFGMDDTFSRVASTHDLANYPPSKAEAEALSQNYYRAASMRYEGNDPYGVRQARDHVIARLRVVLAAHGRRSPPNFGEIISGVLT